MVNNDIYPKRFWAKGDDGWFSTNITDEQRQTLRFLRSVGIELESDNSEVHQEDVLFVIRGEIDDE